LTKGFVLLVWVGRWSKSGKGIVRGDDVEIYRDAGELKLEE